MNQVLWNESNLKLFKNPKDQISLSRNTEEDRKNETRMVESYLLLELL